MSVRLAFVGDVLLGSTVENLLKDHGYDYPYAHVSDLLGQADIAAANLETPVTRRGEPEEGKMYVYRSHPDALPSFKEAGFDLVTLANNHILDYGVTGLSDTLKHLDEQGIHRVGAGMDEEEAYRPVIIEKNGIRTGFVGLSRVVPKGEWKAGPDHPGVAETYGYERALEAIRKAREQADLVVVLVHWGDERQEKPNRHQIHAAHAYIDAGADLVVGSHPHVLQGLEYYEGKWIAYSLGNFIFTTNDHPPTWKGAILEAQCSQDRKCELRLNPVWVKWARPKPMSAEETVQTLNHIESISDRIRFDDSGNVFPDQDSAASSASFQSTGEK